MVAQLVAMFATAHHVDLAQVMNTTAFALTIGENAVVISDQMVVGRSPVCELVLFSDPKVSRLHARFLLSGGGVIIEDLQSANGVFVNGVRIEGTTRLLPGDRIDIGNQHLELVAMAPAHRPRASTATDLRPIKQLDAALDPVFDLDERPTHAGPEPVVIDWHPLRSAIRDGQLNRAQALLRVAFQRVGDSVVAEGWIEDSVREELCEHACALASRTLNGSWLNRLFHLHMLMACPLPHAVAAILPNLVQRVEGLDVSTLDAYVHVLRASQHRLTPVQRRLCVALESALMIADASRR